MRISDNIKNSFEEQYDIPELRLSDEIINFFKSGGNLKIKCKKGSDIHIKKKNRGKFTASAKKAGQSIQEHARSVLNNPNATPLQKKRANFARNAAKWKHQQGGIVKAQEGTILPGELPPLDITSLKGKIKDKVKQRLYDNMYPLGYENPVERVYNAVINNEHEKGIYHNGQNIVTNPDMLYSNVRDDIWATYLGIPHSKKHHNISDRWTISPSSFKPSVTNKSSKDATYYSIDFLRGDPIVEDAKNLKIGENKLSSALNMFLGNHTIGRGYDDKGEYVSYYDKWDLNPLYGTSGLNLPKIFDFDASFGIGKPVEIYDRIYLDDYYGVSEPTHATYLPEVIVKGTRKHKQGGSMRIPGVIDSNPNLDNMKGDYVTPKKKKKKLIKKKK